jgi:hypothetical protein
MIYGTTPRNRACNRAHSASCSDRRTGTWITSAIARTSYDLLDEGGPPSFGLPEVVNSADPASMRRSSGFVQGRRLLSTLFIASLPQVRRASAEIAHSRSTKCFKFLILSFRLAMMEVNSARPYDTRNINPILELFGK